MKRKLTRKCLHSLVTVSCVSESLPYTQKGFSRHGLFRMTPVTAVLGGRGLDVALGRVNIRLHLVLPLGLPLFYLCLQTTSLHSGWSGFGQASALLYVFVSLRYLGVPWIISWTSLHTDSGTKQLGGKKAGEVIRPFYAFSSWFPNKDSGCRRKHGVVCCTSNLLTVFLKGCCF